MQPFKKPSFSYTVKVAAEKQHLAAHLQDPKRRIPAKTGQNVLIASWNLANFGLQKRQKAHLQLMADIIGRFDVVALQEIADDLTHLDEVLGFLGGGWRAIYTDIAGNAERAAYVFDSARVTPSGLAAELAMRGYELPVIEVEGLAADVAKSNAGGFNRNPFMVGFVAGTFLFTLVNVHLYWSNMGLRVFETDALGKWAKSRVNKSFPPSGDIILIGDFNMPHVKKGDPLFDVATKHGVEFPKHTTDLVGTNLAGDNDYDQVAFFPGKTKSDFNKLGVLDFDGALFADLFQKNEEQFFEYMRYYISDHRVLWAEFHR